MECLPDDVLLAVLGHLDNRDLLVCRVVCRHWCELVGHPDLWRRRTVSDQLLRLPPPRCHKLVLSNKYLGRVGYLAATTSCAATQLSITDLPANIYDYAEENYASLGLAALIIRQQASLGRLRKLFVSITCRPEDPNVLVDLYAVALSIEGLQELEFTDVDTTTFVESSAKDEEMLLSAHPDWPAVQPSLEVLMINYFAVPSEVVELLLRTHAPTLKKLNVGYVLFETNKLAGWVSGIPNLQELWCMPMDGLEQLLECRSLRSLRIVIPTYWEYPEALDRWLSSTRSLLGSATQLTHVAFDYRLCRDSECYETDWWGKDLVKALGAAVPSKVSSLKLYCLEYGELMPAVAPLLATVPHLPRLEEVVFSDVISANQLRDLARGAPSLTRLSVKTLKNCLCCSWRKVCDILNASPLLQLTIEIDYNLKKCTNNCAECVVKSTNGVTFKSATSIVKHVSKTRHCKK